MNEPAALISLGRTDVRVSPLGVGTWAWGSRLFWGYGKGYGDADLRAAFETSLDLGINFFDTAEIYGTGRAERLLGEFGREIGTPVVGTKFFPYPWRLRRGSVLSALRASLSRLGIERVDLYQIHWPFPPISLEAKAEELADAVEAGLVRAVGVSNYGPDQLRRTHAALARRGVPLATNQIQYSLLHRTPEQNGVVGACQELGVTLIAYSPLNRGLLSGKYGPGARPVGLARRHDRDDRLAQVQPLVELLRELGAGRGGKTPSQVALNWLMAKGALPIPGAKNAAQARENAGALGWSLSPAEVAALDDASAELTP